MASIPEPESIVVALATQRAATLVFDPQQGFAERPDQVAVEEPLEIRLCHEGRESDERPIAVTMRTPGHDRELALGFLFGEGIVTGARDIVAIQPGSPSSNVLRIVLAAGIRFEAARLERNFYTTSSCGVCGKASIAAVMATVPGGRVTSTLRIGPGLLLALSERLRRAQSAFDSTGGLHAAALFDADGRLVLVREDVGRHNALDKLIGAWLHRGASVPVAPILLLSGRASFELVQKAAVAQIPIVAAIGAPSSLAIRLAEASGITLVGFLRERGYNVYAGGERIARLPPEGDPPRAPGR